MSEAELPETQIKGPETQVIGLRIEAALIPEWFESVKGVAARWCTRMCVIDKPEEYIVKVELELPKVAGFKEDLASAWAVYVEDQKAAGTWGSEE